MAAAHVGVTPSSVPKGGEEVFSFSVPNEEENANTIALEVTFPTKFPIASVLVKPTGRTITTETTKLKKTSKLEFKALQTYSDGTIVRWIDPTVNGTPEPEHPAPTLTLTKATGGH